MEIRKIWTRKMGVRGQELRLERENDIKAETIGQ